MARLVVPGHPHHVTQRGVRRMEVFLVRGDYETYLGLLREWCDKVQRRRNSVRSAALNAPLAARIRWAKRSAVRARLCLPARRRSLPSTPAPAAASPAEGQAACPSDTLIRDSAGMPSPLCSRQTILRVSGRLRLSTS